MPAHLIPQRGAFNTLLARNANAHVHQQLQALTFDLVSKELLRRGLPPSSRTEALAHAIGGAAVGIVVWAIAGREPRTRASTAGFVNALAASMIASAAVES
jgi:hypothetical protein